MKIHIRYINIDVGCRSNKKQTHLLLKYKKQNMFVFEKQPWIHEGFSNKWRSLNLQGEKVLKSIREIMTKDKSG